MFSSIILFTEGDNLLGLLFIATSSFSSILYLSVVVYSAFGLFLFSIDRDSSFFSVELELLIVSSPMIARTPPILMSVPSTALISDKTPALGAGTSTVILSVSI